MSEPRTAVQIANDIEAHVAATYPVELERWGDLAEAVIIEPTVDAHPIGWLEAKIKAATSA